MSNRKFKQTVGVATSQLTENATSLVSRLCIKLVGSAPGDPGPEHFDNVTSDNKTLTKVYTSGKLS